MTCALKNTRFQIRLRSAKSGRKSTTGASRSSGVGTCGGRRGRRRETTAWNASTTSRSVSWMPHEKCRSSAARVRAGGEKLGRMDVGGKAVAVTRGNMLQNYKLSLKHTAVLLSAGGTGVGWGTKFF